LFRPLGLFGFGAFGGRSEGGFLGGAVVIEHTFRTTRIQNIFYTQRYNNKVVA
jgi:hypothetical protein